MYCSVQDVEGYYQNKEFDCTSYLSTDEILAHIVTQSVLIDMTIRKKYTLPIAADERDDLIFLKMINEWLVVGIVDDIIREKDPSQTLERSRDYGKDALEWLKKITDGDIILNSSEKESAIKFNNTDSEGNAVTKPFKVSDILGVGCVVNKENRTCNRCC